MRERIPNLVRHIFAGKSVYCAASLFSPSDRIAAANLAGAVEQALQSYFADTSGRVFLPYRDTNQSQISGPDRAQQIYNQDIQHLCSSAAVFARLDGLAKDAGVCMELGYAHGLNIPTGVLATTFLGEGFIHRPGYWPFDPVIALMCTVKHHAPFSPMITQSYYQSQVLHEQAAVSQFVKNCFNSFRCRAGNNRIPLRKRKKPTIYVDIMGGRYEWSVRSQEELKSELQGAGLAVHCASRYATKSSTALNVASLADIYAASRASVAVFSGDAPELDAGSAAILGFCKARGVRIVFQSTSSVIYKGEGGQTMRSNLMLEQAADALTESTNQSIQIVKHLCT